MGFRHKRKRVLNILESSNSFKSFSSFKKLPSDGLLVLEPSDHLGFGENMAFHGPLQFTLAGSGLEIRLAV